EREVERRDAGDRPQRYAAYLAGAALGAGQPVEPDQLAVDALRLLRGHAERERRALGLEPRGLDRLARLERDRAAEVVARRVDRVGDRVQDLRAAPGRQLAGHLERAHGARDRGLDLVRAGAMDHRDEVVVVGAAHLVGAAGGDRASADDGGELE